MPFCLSMIFFFGVVYNVMIFDRSDLNHIDNYIDILAQTSINNENSNSNSNTSEQLNKDLSIDNESTHNTSDLSSDFKNSQVHSFQSRNILARSLEAGTFVFIILVILILFSILSWAITFYKIFNLKRVFKACNHFVDRFWDYSSLNDLYARKEKFSQSPAKEIFISGYEELLKNTTSSSQSYITIQAALDNISRSIKKSRLTSKKSLEEFLLFLAICASVAPFVGLLGTVWGIMNSFEQIAASGSSSLAVVAPGVSEALIATAFGLAAAIPAVVGYNISQNQISKILSSIDGFVSDYLNIIERYLISQSQSDIDQDRTSSVSTDKLA